MNTKVISTLLSMAFLSVVVFIAALLHVEPLHAATLVFNNVAIEDGSLKALAQVDVYAPAVTPNVKANINATIKSNDAPTTTKKNEDKKENKIEVSSTTELDSFTRDITQNDNNVSNVVVRDDAVAVSYKEPARIFGIIPTEVTVTVEVDNEGNVSVKYPWYVFLSGRNAGQLKPGLQMHVGQILKSATTTMATTTSATSTNLVLSPQVRVELIQAIHNVLKELRMNATTTATTTP